MLRQVTLRTVLLLLLQTTSAFATNNWQILAPGLEYQDLSANLLTPWSHIHVFRIDLNRNDLNVITAKSLSQLHASATEFTKHSKALLSINGGFFDQNYQPLGLRISHQQQYNPLKNISWWGVFFIANQKPFVVGGRDFKTNKAIDFAVQSGPRLIIDGDIPRLKPGLAERSALGITAQGHVIILATEGNPMTTTALAHLMKERPLFCKNAINLDGGSSTQLHAHINAFQINVHGFSNVSDAIVVTPRNREHPN